MKFKWCETYGPIFTANFAFFFKWQSGLAGFYALGTSNINTYKVWLVDKFDLSFFCRHLFCLRALKVEEDDTVGFGLLQFQRLDVTITRMIR
jgi:hypothetical protein